jgi:hypothetical protein
MDDYIDANQDNDDDESMNATKRSSMAQEFALTLNHVSKIFILK